MNWSIDPEIINFGGISLRYYGFLFVAGLMCSIYVLKWIFKQEGINEAHLDKLSLYMVIGVLAGARIGHCLFYEPAYFLNHPLEIILPITPAAGGGYRFSGFQGLASHGGIIGMIIALYFYTKKTGESYLKTMDLIAVASPLGGCFIRIGNFMNSEIIGVPSDLPWAVVFQRIDNVPRHPAQLYESVSYLIIFIIMILLYKTRGKKVSGGFFIGLALMLVFSARFFIEFIKEKQVLFEEQMRFDMGQMLSIPFVLTGLAFIIYGFFRRKQISDVNQG